MPRKMYWYRTSQPGKNVLQNGTRICSAWISSITEFQIKDIKYTHAQVRSKNLAKVVALGFQHKKDFGWHDDAEIHILFRWRVYE